MAFMNWPWIRALREWVQMLTKGPKREAWRSSELSDQRRRTQQRLKEVVSEGGERSVTQE